MRFRAVLWLSSVAESMPSSHLRLEETQPSTGEMFLKVELKKIWKILYRSLELHH